MKGICESCGQETEVHPYIYKLNPQNIIYLCDPCFWKLPSSKIVELQTAKSDTKRRDK